MEVVDSSIPSSKQLPCVAAALSPPLWQNLLPTTTSPFNSSASACLNVLVVIGRNAPRWRHSYDLDLCKYHWWRLGLFSFLRSSLVDEPTVYHEASFKGCVPVYTAQTWLDRIDRLAWLY